MLKILLPTLLIFSMPNLIFHHMLLLIILISLMIIKSSNYKLMMINMFMSFDSLSMLMILLTLISTILITLSSFSWNKISKMMIPIFTILMTLFMVKNMLHFYILFEIVLIPTMILIMMNGKQSERLQASIYLIIYTVTASLPLLITIITLKTPSFMMSNINMLKFNLIILMLLAFLVKMPMYFLHLWLPKAHVEAPLEGSMILAAVLLKLGGYGIIRFMPLCLKFINSTSIWIISISLIGATATSLNCIRQKDLKSLIAYSSVAHMGFVLCGIFSMSYIGLTGSLIMMLAHGLSSSALFFLTNDLYLKFHSRNMLLFKSMITIMPNMTFWWFILMAINISAPPTINTFSEILMISSTLFWNKYSIILLFMMSLATASFSMSMFINISHNKIKNFPSLESTQKTFMSLLLHSIPLIIILLKMDMFM